MAWQRDQRGRKRRERGANSFVAGGSGNASPREGVFSFRTEGLRVTEKTKRFGRGRGTSEQARFTPQREQDDRQRGLKDGERVASTGTKARRVGRLNKQSRRTHAPGRNVVAPV